MFSSRIVQFQKISILPPWKVFCFASPLPPGNSCLSSYIASSILALKDPPPPLPLGISSDLPWGGYGFFLELHIIQKKILRPPDRSGTHEGVANGLSRKIGSRKILVEKKKKTAKSRTRILKRNNSLGLAGRNASLLISQSIAMTICHPSMTFSVPVERSNQLSYGTLIGERGHTTRF